MQLSFQNRTYLVTGGGSGIGKGVAAGLVAAGASVMIVGRNPDRLAGAVDIGEPVRCADARALDLPDGCVALVVTSPPYFAGKEYETALGEGAVPASYLEYLGMLRDVFAE